MEKTIIHISGASGSGKTTLGNNLQTYFNNKIIVKDLDELLDDYFDEHFGKNSSHNLGDINEESYQNYIYDYIRKQTEPIVFVGLNDNLIDFYPFRKDIYYDVQAKYKYYIDIDDNLIVKQKCMRFLDRIKNDTDMMENIVTNNEDFMRQIIEKINIECNKEYIMQWINKWKIYYKNQGYEFMPREDIYDDIIKIINNNILGGRKKKIYKKSKKILKHKYRKTQHKYNKQKTKKNKN